MEGPFVTRQRWEEYQMNDSGAWLEGEMEHAIAKNARMVAADVFWVQSCQS